MRTIFEKSSVRVLALVIGLLIAIWILSLLGVVFVMVLVALVMTYVLAPVVDMMETRGLNRVVSILLLYLVIAFFIVGLLSTILPPLIGQVSSLEDAIRSPAFAERLSGIQAELHARVPFINFGDISDQLNRLLIQLAGRWLTILTSAGSAMIMLVIVPFVAFFFLKDGDALIRRFIALVPNRYFEMTLNVVSKIGIQLGRYVRAWLTEAAIVGVLAIIGLSFMGVKYAVIIGAAAGIANLIPYLGPVVGAVPAIIVSFVQTGNAGLFFPIVALFIAIRLLDDIVIVPTVYSRGVSVHPLTVVLVILVAAELKGIVGMVLAIPLYTVFRVIVKETYWGLESYRITKTEAKRKALRTE
ncbi:MAG: AI-2E family transporter [Bacteroidetes bacterium]|jgi:predicted PurR-regulated permease PerM|nr:AI-2E family transporter [Bacteroidota bacterium]